jgi:hypothetical protein
VKPAVASADQRVLRSAGCRLYAESSCWLRALVTGGTVVSIVRVGLSETKNFAEGYDLIFGNKKGAKAKKTATPAKAESPKRKKKKAKKK